MSQNPPRRHHWVPQFLLRQWLRPDGTLPGWKRERGVLTQFGPTTDDVMWKWDLYRAEHLKDPAGVEAFFRQVESLAARVVVKLLDPKALRLTDEEHFAWCSFIMSMRLRPPEGIKEMRTRWGRLVDADILRKDSEFEALNTDPDIETPADYLAKHMPGFRDDGFLSNLPTYLTDPVRMERLRMANWHVRRNIHVPLLLGDRPLIAIGSWYDGGGVMALPIAPDAVFYAVQNPSISEQLEREPSKSFAVELNHLQAIKAQRIIVGDVERRFLENRNALRHDPAKT